MKKILVMLGFLVCVTAFAADQTSVDKKASDLPAKSEASDKKALQKSDKPAKIDGCCRICKTDKSKPCGNACISLGAECAKGQGCACTPDGKHELEEKPIWVAPK